MGGRAHLSKALWMVWRWMGEVTNEVGEAFAVMRIDFALVGGGGPCADFGARGRGLFAVLSLGDITISRSAVVGMAGSPP